MQTIRLALVMSLFVSFCLCADTQAQQAGQVESMKLLTTDTGWAATKHKLFWTTDGGTQWKDITPKLNHKSQAISSVFFLDSSTGWVLLNCGDDRNPTADDVCFEFALTTSAGDNWSVVRTKIVDPVPSSVIKEDAQGFSGATYLDFADAQHGWAVLRRSLPVGRSAGVMLRTNDGGRTWMQLASDTLPMAESFRFVNSKDGWLAGGPDQELYATHDAGTSWHEALLPKPTAVGPDTGISYDLPVFVNEHRGFISVRYAVGPLMGPDQSTLALFATDDGGLTWRQDRVLARLPDIYSSDLAGSVLIAAHSEQVKAPRNTVPNAATKISLYTLGPGQSTTSNTAEVSSQGAATQLSFVDGERGWANLLDRLFSTRDAGKTWVDVTPGGPPPRLAPLPQASSRRVTLQGSGVPASLPIPGSSGTNSSHLAFDGYNVPTIPQMSAWITSSPFYDVYIYLPHSPNRHNDPILVSKNGPGWISSVEGQGWGVVPIWFGLQSTCVITQTGITQFISTTPATASTQGAEQADQAVAQDKLLGVTSGIIYLDVENYKLGATCSAAVQAYVDGFVSEIGAYPGFNAGVYANPAPITGDISKVSPLPAAIWIAKADTQVTIWNQGISDNLWPNGQRMHQFLNNTNPNNAPNATWGGVPLSIDYDIDNGPVLNANAIAKPYLYTAANIDCPGAISTIPTAINDMNNGAVINASGQMGTVVGTYQTSLVGPIYGFQNAGGTCSNITVFGSSDTEPWGINNLGQIVGHFEDSEGMIHGFLLSPGKNPVQIDYNGGGQTYLFGINDAGQIVGWAYSPETFGYQTFMYYSGSGTFYPLGYSNSSFEYTLGYGINGDAMLTGAYYYEPTTEDFQLAAVPTPPSWTWEGTVIGLSPGGSATTVAKGINANGESAGFYNSTNCSDTAYQCSFEWSGGDLIVLLQYGSDANVAEGLNDFAQVVGPYTDSVTGYSHGLLWTHQ